jgi:hypothetical protein
MHNLVPLQPDDKADEYIARHHASVPDEFTGNSSGQVCASVMFSEMTDTDCRRTILEALCDTVLDDLSASPIYA